MRVAYLGVKGLPSRGGAERVVEALVRRMPSLGISPTVYCDQEYTSAEVSVPEVELVRLPALPGKHLRMTSLDFATAVHAVVRGRYDLIHLHNVEASFVLPLLRLRYRVVSTSHGAAYWRAKWGSMAKGLIQMMDYPFIKFSTEVTCVSAKDAQELNSRFNRRPVYIPNGVSMEHTPDFEGARALLAGHSLMPGEYFIFVAGRIEPTKGAHLAIEALGRLENDVPLLVVGDDTQVPAYGRQLRETAGPRVRFQPLVEDPRILFGLMADATCLVFPSLVEAMSMVLLEAASLKVPILCSDIVENRTVLQNDCVYFESENVDSLTEQLAWVLGHREDVAGLSQRAWQRVQAEYSWDTIAGRYAQLYREVVRNQHE